MLTTYSATREAIRDTLTPFSWQDIKKANKAMKKVFGDRLSMISGGQTTIEYYILVKDEDEWELVRYDWDFFERSFE